MCEKWKGLIIVNAISKSLPIRSSWRRSAISSGHNHNPQNKSMVLCVDEKSQIKALDHSQPLLLMALGYVERVTHGYNRHGTTTLFAALNIADVQVLT